MGPKDIILAGVLGLDMSDVNHAILIAESTRYIADMDTFIEYCRDNKNGIKYETKTEKLDTLSNKYKSLQEEAILEARYAQGKDSAKALADKVKTARNFIEDRGIDFSQLGVDGHKFFTKKEITALEAIGTTLTVIEYSRINLLAEKIYNYYVERLRSPRKYNSLRGMGVKSALMGCCER